MTSLLDKLLGEATRLTRTGRLHEATAAIQQALAGFGPPHGAAADATVVEERPAPGPTLHREALAPGIETGRAAPGWRMPAPDRSARGRTAEPAVDVPAADAPAQPDVQRRSATGSFETHVYAGRTGTRQYKLFVPAGRSGQTLGLILMLHGCTQTPDDFAAGTRMNEVAAERGFLVLYPAQAPRSNHSKCWNWFQPGDQRRGGGEPDLLASLTRHIVQTHPVDPARVYVAGLSAGGAMADILGREYPDVFAAVGVHSGLPQGAAHDIPSAFAAMRHGAGAGAASGPDLAIKAPGAPTIVFHGDADATVHPSNGARVIGAALAGAAAAEVATERRSAGDRPVTRSVHRRPQPGGAEPSLAEHWIVHGAGHAWSGGDPAGSYADARGPDASREMVRFFEEHPRRRT